MSVGNEATLSGVFGAGDSVVVRVRPFDGLDEGLEKTSDPVEILPE